MIFMGMPYFFLTIVCSRGHDRNMRNCSLFIPFAEGCVRTFLINVCDWQVNGKNENAGSYPVRRQK